MPDPAITYHPEDPEGGARWPWRVEARPAKWLGLPEPIPEWSPSGWINDYFGIREDVIRIEPGFCLDGYTYLPGRLREWLWPIGVCSNPWCRCHFRRKLYRLLDAPNRWLMRRWPGAALAHDALRQVADSLPRPGSSYRRSPLGLWVRQPHRARAFRAYADRQLRLMIRAAERTGSEHCHNCGGTGFFHGWFDSPCTPCNGKGYRLVKLSPRWTDRFLAFLVRWACYLAVRANAAYKSLRSP